MTDCPAEGASLDDLLQHAGELLSISSADARAGLGALLREIAYRDPQMIERAAAEVQLRRLGIGKPAV